MNLTDYEWTEMRKLLNKAWTARENHHIAWDSSKATRNSARYRDVSKIIKEAQAVDWAKLNKPDKVEETNDEHN